MQPSGSTASRFRMQNHEMIALQPTEIPCRFHPGSICLNYCHEDNCLRLLCEECIEEHLEYHKKNSLPVSSIRSLKKVRQFSVQKLIKLIEELGMQMGSLKQPKSPKEILQEANMKFDAIKKIMFEIIEQELTRFYEQLRAKVNQSFSTIKNLQQIHDNLSRIVAQLQESKSIIIEGNKEMPETLESVIRMKDQIYVDNFSRQALEYSQKLSHVDFDISINQQIFKNSITESLRIKRFEHEPPIVDRSQVRGMMNVSRSRSKSPLISKSNVSLVDPKMETDFKILHFFETDSSNLHLIDLSSPKKMKKQVVELLSGNYTVPTFHASLLSAHGYIFISGGLVEIGDSDMKVPYVGKFSLKGNQFKKDFSKVKPRSSHCMCECGDFLYILGGFGVQDEDEEAPIENSLEKVNIKNGHVENLARSKYGGHCIATVTKNQILSASEEGVELFNLANKTWTPVKTNENYCFIIGCGWSKVNEQTLLVYGGYDSEEKGVDACFSWEITDNFLSARNCGFRLPSKEGFVNSPGVVRGNELFALQNIVNDGDENEENIMESERRLIKFDGSCWEQIYMSSP